MPVYDYLCSNCRALTEVIHGIDAPGPRFCPACGAEGTLRKAFAPPAVHFKGSGWAKKDRSTASTKARSKADAGTETGSAAGAGKAGSPSGDSPASTDKAATGSTSTPASGSGSSESSGSSERSGLDGSSRSTSHDARKG